MSRQPLLVDFLILPIGHYQVVLGTHLMRSIGEIALNLQDMLLCFTTNCTTYSLQGTVSLPYELVAVSLQPKDIHHSL